MKNRSILISIVMIFIVPAISNAQIGSMLRNKAAKVINAGAKTLNKEAGKEIDTAAQKEVNNAMQNSNENVDQNHEQNNAATGEAEPSGNQQSKGINFGGLMGGKVNLKYNQSYSFNSRIYMQMEMYDKKDVMKMDYNIYFSDASPDAGFESKMVATSEEGENMAMLTSSVFDGVNKIFIILTDMGTMKMGIISEIPDESTLQDQPAENTPKPTITKTGNSRIIAGYKCDEYLYKDNQTKEYGKLWVTKDLKLKGDNRIYSKAGLPSYYGTPELEGGVVLAMESYNDKNELEMKSETKEIDLNYKHSISVAGYSLRQMNFNQAGGKSKK